LSDLTPPICRGGESRAMSTWLIAVVGGVAGTVLTWMVLAVAKLVAAPKQIAANERAVWEYDQDLATWIVDRDHALRRQLAGERGKLAARGAIQSGDYAFRLGLVKEQALHEWRDEERRTQRDVARIRDSEGWQHRIVRRFSRLPNPSLSTSAYVGPILRNWRAPIPPGGDRSAEPVPLYDPTATSLFDVAAAAEAETDEYQ